MISPTDCHILLTGSWLRAHPVCESALHLLLFPTSNTSQPKGSNQHLFFFFTSSPGTLKSCITKSGHLQLHCLEQQVGRHLHLHSTAFQVADSALGGLELLPTDGTLRDHWFAAG